MIPLSRSVSLLAARTGLVVVMLGFAMFGLWTAGDLLGRQRVEEEETPKTKAPPKKKKVEEEEESPRKRPNRKVIRVEGDDEPKEKSKPNRPSAPSAIGDLNQLAEQATHPAVKELFRSLAVPHDLVLFKRTPRVTVGGKRTQYEDKVEPIPLHLGNNPSRYRRERIRFTPLTHDWQRDKPYTPSVESLELVRPYEEIAQDKVSRFLQAKFIPEDPDAPRALSRYDKLVAAEQVLSSVLRWHESARQTGKRSGEDWAPVEKSLRKQLLDEVRLEQMKVLAQAQNWEKVLDLAHRLADTYPDPVERQRIFHPVADMIKSALNDPTGSPVKKQKARERLLQLEREFPGNSALHPLGDTLRGEAQGLLDSAKDALHKKKNKELARTFLLRAKGTWPDLPELRPFENELNKIYPILRVGVRGPLPKYFSPALACTDNEHRAVELLFESLVKLVPDEAGGFRYRLGLAESRPKVVSLGRQFELPRNTFWSNKQPLNSHDINYSWQLLKSGRGVGRSRVWSKLLAPPETRDPFRVTLRMKQGFLDPLALMTFKILPSELDVNSEEFATQPVTSGPFLLDLKRRSDENRECVFFVANPYYGLRATKRGLPHIQEIRFYSYTNPVEELTNDKSELKLDLVLDLTAKETQTLLEKQRAERLPIEVSLPSSAVPNRRIYFLAINNRKLSNAKLRQALAFAINREALLDKHFRGSLKVRPHKALNGPFPVGSWANPSVNDGPNKDSVDLFNADRAKNQMVGVEKPTNLKLKYPQGQPGLDEAMKDLCDQVKEGTGIVLDPEGCNPYQLREDVEQRHHYDLAYYHYDFPDESYWLAPLLGPPPRVTGDKNIFQLTPPEIAKLLSWMESYRDFAEVRKYQWAIHKKLYDEMPFIPLWQLDPLLAYRRDVLPAALDRQLVFRNIEEWRKAAAMRE